MSLIESLPDEILCEIIGYVHASERLNVRNVCKKFKNVIDSELAAIEGFQFIGRSIRSMLDFVTDAKKKEIPCKEHYISGVNTIRTTANFGDIALTISIRLTRLKYLRLHKTSLTWEGFKLLTNSPFWTETLHHLDIKSCYLEDPQCQTFGGTSITIVNRSDVFNMKKPGHLKHFNLILMSEQDDLLFILEYLTQDLKAKFEDGTEKGIIYNVQTPRSSLSSR